MKFLNSLWINMKKLVFSGKFIFSAIIFAAFCFASKYINGEASPPTIIEFIFRFISDPEEYSHISAQEMFGYFDNSYWFSIIFPVLVSFAAITDFHDEWFSSAYYSSISRQGNLRFALSKTFSYAISGVLLTAFGIIIYGAAVFSVFPFSGDEIYLNFAAEAMLKVLNLLALGAVYPLISVIIMMFFRDRFLSLSIPLVINYLSARLDAIYAKIAYFDGKIEILKLSMLLPYTQNRQYTEFEEVYLLNFGIWFAFCGAVFLLLGTAFYFLIKRRVKHA